MGGEIFIQSDPSNGRGTTFVFTWAKPNSDQYPLEEAGTGTKAWKIS